ncbi:hypothetical protein G6F55_014343 [Rhizopus delemar]|nr:hypothetical protein G6F55_014343 [Rhizopus delemar]
MNTTRSRGTIATVDRSPIHRRNTNRAEWTGSREPLAVNTERVGTMGCADVLTWYRTSLIGAACTRRWDGRGKELRGWAGCCHGWNRP